MTAYAKILSLLLFYFVHLTTAAAPTVLIPSPPVIAAKSYILMDYQTKQPLITHDSNERLEPASLTKIMTVYVIDQALKNGKITLQDKVRISKNAWNTQGSRMFVEVDKYVTVNDLIKGIVIQSGNDASVAMAEYIAGSENSFAGLMNQAAQELGMTNSHFENATGLPNPNHYSSAHDLATLARAVIHDFPESYSIYSQKEFIFNGIAQTNRNRLLWRNLGVDGLKTGFTDNAGYCLIASAKQNDMRLISVILGSASDNVRADDTEKLLTYGFRFYETHKLYTANQSLGTARVWMGNENNVDLGLLDDFYITVPQGHYKNLAATMTIKNTITAPVLQNTQYGKLTLQLNNKIIKELPLVALETIDKGNIWQRLIDYIKLFIHEMFN